MWGGSCLYIGNVINVGRCDWTCIALRSKRGCSIGQEASSWDGRCRFAALCSLRWTCHVNEMPLIFSRRARSQNKYWRQEVWQIYSSACVRGCLATTMKQWNILPRPARSCNFLLHTKDEVSHYFSNKHQCNTLDKDDGNKIYDRKPTT